MITNIPFAGFYCSHYDSELDNTQESEVDYRCEEHPFLYKTDFADKLFNLTNWSVAHEYIAKKYVEFFNNRLTDELGFDPGFKFESMSSPREYNFVTDRIFAHVSDEVAQRLFDEVDKARLAAVIKARFTSCDGFISHYSNYLSDWLETDVEAWDHNELCTLIMAWLPEDFEINVFLDMCENDCFYQALDKAVEWEKLESYIEEKQHESMQVRQEE